MRRILVAGATTASGLVLLMSYPTSTDQPLGGAVSATPGAVAPDGASPGGGTAAKDPPASPSTDGTTPSTDGTTPSTDGTTPSAGGTTTPSAAPSGTYTGASVGTRWGNVQVEISVENGAIVDARAVQVPDGSSTDQQINSSAVPVLEDETVQAGSAHIDAVTGATVTSTGYIASLQSALDEAGLR